MQVINFIIALVIAILAYGKPGVDMKNLKEQQINSFRDPSLTPIVITFEIAVC